MADRWPEDHEDPRDADNDHALNERREDVVDVVAGHRNGPDWNALAELLEAEQIKPEHTERHSGWNRALRWAAAQIRHGAGR
ncbi:MAG: hypothetical protein GY719_31615 [bacterium]|nr:hypothetical protein [bacterium]